MADSPHEQARRRAVLSVLDELADTLGDRLTTDAVDREGHGADSCYHAAASPDAVAYPASVAEVQAIAAACHAHRVPLVPYGTGTGVEGGVVAVRGGISVDLSQLNRIIEIHPVDGDVLVEAGVTRHQLNDALADRQLPWFFPVDPGADASLGGMAATCASGSSTVGYGTMRENVLGLRVVLADGRLIECGGRARKSSAGYDLTRLFVGSEGTLGIIVGLRLKLSRQPEHLAAATCSFGDVATAVSAALELLHGGGPVARLEMLDARQMEAVNRYSGLQHPAAPTLFCEFHGSQRGVEEQLRLAAEVAARHGGENFQSAVDPAARKRLWQARYDSYYAALALREGAVGYVTDVCVPVSQLAVSIADAQQRMAASSIPATLFGHVGDGNYHVVFLIQPGADEELAEVSQIHQQIVDHALSLGGTCTGEHGIGLGKIAALRKEAGDAVDVMQQLKAALDPHGIMNPGKLFAK